VEEASLEGTQKEPKEKQIKSRIYFLINNGMQVPATMYYSLDQTT
jgi:hypothetical protein